MRVYEENRNYKKSTGKLLKGFLDYGIGLIRLYNLRIYHKKQESLCNLYRMQRCHEGSSFCLFS